MSIKAKFAKSGAWMMVSAIFNNLSSMIIFVALARLLTPTQFGIVAFATIFIELSRTLVVAGIPDALIQRKGWDDDVASSAFWTNIGLSLAICMVISLIAAPLSYFGYDEIFALVLFALSFALVIEALTTVHTAKLRREFRYKAIAGRNMVANVLGGVIGIALAAIGWGVWALVASRLLSASLTSIILWRTSGWTPQLSFRWDHVRSLSRTSFHLLSNQLIGQANTQIAGLIIGVAIGPAAVAQFRVGTRILDLMAQLVISPLQAAAMSAFSRLANDGKPIGPAYTRVTRTCSLIACPMFFGAAAIAPDVIHVLFGSQWTEAATIMVINSVVVGPSVIMYFFVPALAAAGYSALSSRHYFASLIVNVTTAVAAAPLGLLAIAAAKTIQSHLTLPYGLRLTKQAIGLGALDNLRAVAPAYLASISMGGAVWALGHFALGGMTPLSRLAIMAVAGVLLYAALLAVFARRFFKDNLSELTSLFGRFKQSRPVRSTLEG